MSTCKTCIHWEPYNNDTRGTCALADNYQACVRMPADGFMAEGSVPAAEVVVTGPDFGCIHWSKE